MSIKKRYLPILAGALALAGLAGTAQAQTVINIGGSSAARNFMGNTPLNLCDAGADITTYPKYYISADNNLHTWVCNRAGLPIIIRYSATGSSDGINKLLQPANNSASNMNFLDHTLSGCTGPTDTTRVSDSKHYALFSCPSTNTTSQGVTMGASDVQGSSFHQQGPLGTVVNPLDDSGLNSVQVAVVPFSIYVGKGVVQLDSAGTSPNGPITGLSRLQIEAIFNRAVTDWTRLGFGTVTDAAPGTLETSSPIVLCLRNAGSGTKAAFAATLMINASETNGGPASVIFSSSTSGVQTCLEANRRSIGYMDSDQVTRYLTGGAAVGLAYVVPMDGGLANNPVLPDRKRDLKCGKYAYWAGERLNRRSTSEGSDIDALQAAFVADASSAATIALIPQGVYWTAFSDMVVSKNSDKGPLIWTAGAHPQCR